jgi:beta propeller repeat protein
MDMVKAALPVAAALLVFSCSTRYVTVVTKDDAGDGSGDAVDHNVESDGKDNDADDYYLDPVEAIGDNAEDVERFESMLVDCTIPVRDCGPGCRQVTCAADTLSSYLWDVYHDVLVYMAGTPEADPYLLTLFEKRLDIGEEKKIYEFYEYVDDYIIPSMPKSFAFFDNILTYAVYNRGVEEPECRGILELFNLNFASKETLICYSDWSAVEEADMHDDILVWSGYEADSPHRAIRDLFLFNLDTREKVQLTDGARAYAPKLWGRQFVFEMGDREVTNSWDVFLWDLDTMSYRNLTLHPSDQWSPDIWENRVVWVDHRNDPSGNYIAPHNSDIYWCELPDCEPVPATTNWATQEHPTVGGDWIAWIDYRNDVNPLNPASSYHENLEIWGYNISIGEEYLLASQDTTLWPRIRIENGNLYFPGRVEYGVGAIFEVDLSQFVP